MKVNGTPSRSLILTGGTGILGSWILNEALEREMTPILLMRDENVHHAETRLNAVLRLLGKQSMRGAVQIVRGDAREPNLGLSLEDADALRSKVGAFIHCAASTSFNPKDDENLWATNVTGVENVLDFVSHTGMALYHISTAYVAGTRNDIAHEGDLDVGQDFNNTYERTKCISEGLVREAFADGRSYGAIFRPSIIVGATDHGKICDFQNFYGFLRLVDMATARKPNEQMRIRLEGNADTDTNLVPVDWTAKALWHVIQTEGDRCLTYHLTNPYPDTVGRLKEWVNQIVSESNVEFDVVRELDGTPSPLEGIAHNAFQHYRVYLKHQPVFDRTNTVRATGEAVPFPQLGSDLYERLLNYARAQRWRGALSSRALKHTAQPDAAAV
ncbi:MAG: SDR family oxidoreductase [Candidatus Hydrogenedentes bacterium]|nr:SDR family oxidoreductase [Candidatus Hydrogenedentota bacterium]